MLNVLLFFGAYRYTQGLLFSEQQQFESLRRRMLEEEGRIERLKTSREALPQTGKKLESLEREHTPVRRQAYSQTAKLLRVVAEESGVSLTASPSRRIRRFPDRCSVSEW